MDDIDFSMFSVLSEEKLPEENMKKETNEEHLLIFEHSINKRSFYVKFCRSHEPFCLFFFHFIVASLLSVLLTGKTLVQKGSKTKLNHRTLFNIFFSFFCIN